MKKKIISCLILSTLLAYPLQGRATCGLVDPEAAGYGTPWTTVDYGRSITGIIKGILEQTGDGEIKAQIIATQEGTNQNAGGSSSGGSETGQGSSGSSESSKSESDSNSDPGSAGADEFVSATYSYVKTQLFDKSQVVQDAALKKALAGGDTRQAVLKTFFADPSKEEEKTTEYQTKILNQRKAYAKEAGERHTTLAYRVLWGGNKAGGISKDLDIISTAALTGDGELGAIAVGGYTLDQAIQMELVDIAMQIELMEADAIQFMLHQPIELMDETKPIRNDQENADPVEA